MSFAVLSNPPKVTVATILLLVGIAFAYLLGWYRLRTTRSQDATEARLFLFLSGELAVFVVMGSPLAELHHHWLTAHMLQHLILMTCAAPLLLLGEPGIMLLGSWPERLSLDKGSRSSLKPLIKTQCLLQSHPAINWMAGTSCVLVWHVPTLFDLAMHSTTLHSVEEISFFGAGLFFWLPVIQPWPYNGPCHRWAVPMYLFLATIPCDALSAFLTFCDRVVYQSYASGSHISMHSALQDQQRAGALMWVWVTFAYLIPAVIIAIRALSPVNPALHQAARLVDYSPYLDGRVSR